MAFWQAADPFWQLVHFTLAKTGLRVGEAVHLLVDGVDWGGRWLWVRNQPGLGWTVKTGFERRVPMLPELAAALQAVARGRTLGPVFLRQRLWGGLKPRVVGARAESEEVLGSS